MGVLGFATGIFLFVKARSRPGGIQITGSQTSMNSVMPMNVDIVQEMMGNLVSALYETSGRRLDPELGGTPIAITASVAEML